MSAAIRRLAGPLVLAIGAAVLAGWLLDPPVLISVLPDHEGMAPNTAFGLMAIGAALWMLNKAPLPALTRRAIASAALMVAALGLLTLLEYLFHLNLGIDQMFLEVSTDERRLYPGRVAPYTALSFMLLAGALWRARDNTERGDRWAQGLSLGTLAIVLMELSDDLYGARLLYGTPRGMEMSLSTAVALIIAACGILALRPHRGLMAVLTDPGPGGVLARRLIPATILLVPAIGWARLEGELAGWYNTAFGVALTVALTASVITALVWRLADSLTRSDRLRRRAEKILHDSVALLESRVAERTREAQDVTESLRIKNQELQTILDIAPVQIWFGDADCGKFTGNSRAYEEHGLEPGINASFDAPVLELPSGLRIEVDGRALTPGEMPMQIAARTGKPVHGFEHDVLHPDGKRRTMLANVSPVLNPDGTVRSVIGVYIDITERKRAEEELLKSSKLESIGLLAGGIAHDFNNILTAIIGNLSLAEITLDPSQKAFGRIEESKKAVLRAQSLTHQLLTFSRGGQPVREPAALGQLLKDSALFALQGSNVRCECAVPDGLWPVEADQGQINQAVHNLILNAQQAMPDGGTIRIQAFNLAVRPDDRLPLAPGDYVGIRVKDHGAGIPPEDLAKIFDPFFTTKPTGSGLGLTTVYWIVKRHRGYVFAASTPGAGT
ncbi:MAG: ATP-binding protein, partial [Nitrospirota bacterium]